jgi:hypothetical protein
MSDTPAEGASCRAWIDKQTVLVFVCFKLHDHHEQDLDAITVTFLSQNVEKR